MHFRLAFVAMLGVPFVGCFLGAFESGPCGQLITLPSIVVSDSTTGKSVCDATVIAVPAALDGAAAIAPASSESDASPEDAAADGSTQDQALSFALKATPTGSGCVYSSPLFGQAFEDGRGAGPTYSVQITKSGFRTVAVTVSASETMPSSCLVNDEIVTSGTPVKVALTPS